MIDFIHTGDVHLGLKFNNVSFHREKAMERRRELWSTFERIVRHSGQSNMDFLFIAGDLFEERYFTLGDMHRVRDMFKEIEDVNVIISAGNHDYIGQSSLYNRVEWSNNVTIFTGEGIQEKRFKDLKTVVYGYSWDRLEIRENTLFDEFPEEDNSWNRVLIIHGDIGTSSNYLPLNIKQLKDLNMDYIALGHIHKPEMITHKIAYCGCPEPLHFGETGDRGIVQGRIENGRTKIEFIPFSKRRFIIEELILNEDMGYSDIIKEFHKIDKESRFRDFYRVQLKGYIDNNMDLESLYKDLEADFYHLEIVNDTLLDYDLDSLEATYSDSIIGYFIRDMKDKDLNNPIVKDALYFGLSSLLKGMEEL